MICTICNREPKDELDELLYHYAGSTDQHAICKDCMKKHDIRLTSRCSDCLYYGDSKEHAVYGICAKFKLQILAYYICSNHKQRWEVDDDQAE
jgi:hypothetical protein